jgi:hypothetical protein
MSLKYLCNIVKVTEVLVLSLRRGKLLLTFGGVCISLRPFKCSEVKCGNVEGGTVYGFAQLLCGKYMACIEWNCKCPILVNAGYMNRKLIWLTYFGKRIK